MERKEVKQWLITSLLYTHCLWAIYSYSPIRIFLKCQNNSTLKDISKKIYHAFYQIPKHAMSCLCRCHQVILANLPISHNKNIENAPNLLISLRLQWHFIYAMLIFTGFSLSLFSIFLFLIQL